MAAKYDTQRLRARALAAIEKNKLVFISEVIRSLPCHSAAFYRHGLNADEDILDALENNRTALKGELRSKMFASESPVAWAMLYKLIGSKEEVERLSNSTKRIEHSGNVQLGHVVIEPKALTESIEGELLENDTEDIRLLESGTVQ